jgi:hypothetical protein
MRGRRFWSAIGRFRSVAVLAAFLVLGAPLGALEYPRVANPAWDVGERLTYAVKFGPIRAGTSVLAVEDEIVWNGRKVVRIKSTTNSADWFFYRVRDSIISYMDKEGLFAWRYEKYQREGNYRNNEITTFNHETRKAHRNDDGVRHEPMEIERFVRDVLGALYYVRAQTFAVGDVIKIPVHDGRRSYTMEVDVLRKERVRVPAGEFNCVVIEPKLQSEGIFLKKGRLMIWVTDDARHIPVQIRTAIPVGSVVASLESMSGVKGE